MGGLPAERRVRRDQSSSLVGSKTSGDRATSFVTHCSMAACYKPLLFQTDLEITEQTFNVAPSQVQGRPRFCFGGASGVRRQTGSKRGFRRTETATGADATHLPYFDLGIRLGSGPSALDGFLPRLSRHLLVELPQVLQVYIVVCLGHLLKSTLRKTPAQGDL